MRKVANTARTWLKAQHWSDLIAWLDRDPQRPQFDRIMGECAPWSEDQAPITI